MRLLIVHYNTPHWVSIHPHAFIKAGVLTGTCNMVTEPVMNEICSSLRDGIVVSVVLYLVGQLISSPSSEHRGPQDDAGVMVRQVKQDQGRREGRKPSWDKGKLSGLPTALNISTA